MKPSTSKLKKATTSLIREVVVQFRPLETEKFYANTPEKIASFLREIIGDDCRESFVTVCLTQKNMVVGYSIASTGTVSETIVHPREIFVPAILSKASGIVVAHNHPSGTLEPSRQDIDTTNRLKEAGILLGIPVMDHVIVAFDSDDCFSFKANNLI